MEPNTKANTIPQMTDDEMRKFVLDLCDGKIFTSAHIDAEQLVHSFPLLGLGVLDGWTKDEIMQIGCIYEYLANAGPLSINHQPTFMSLRLLHRDDWDRALAAHHAENERRRGITV